MAQGYSAALRQARTETSQIISTFRKRDATTPRTAKTLEELQLPHTYLLHQLQRDDIVRKVGRRHYYLYEMGLKLAAKEEFQRNQMPALMMLGCGMIAVLAALVTTLLIMIQTFFSR